MPLSASHEGRVACPRRREPQALLPSPGETGEAPVLDLVAAGAVLVGVGGEDRIGPEIDPDPAGKGRGQQQATRDSALGLEPTVKRKRLQRTGCQSPKELASVS
jgi:hypothetical protein